MLCGLDESASENWQDLVYVSPGNSTETSSNRHTDKLDDEHSTESSGHSLFPSMGSSKSAAIAGALVPWAFLGIYARNWYIEADFGPEIDSNPMSFHCSSRIWLRPPNPPEPDTIYYSYWNSPNPCQAVGSNPAALCTFYPNLVEMKPSICLKAREFQEPLVSMIGAEIGPLMIEQNMAIHVNMMVV
ncbi:hypothetical protein AYO21_00615 [Fonsecaea monophora]|uniref:Uncharacterized protein n=1 Tax=Fonsecaea monophora TaxID=254056 RepID=A0A177FM29_9EURO|nr:hypothetical protein AYO21_00615 [Fonsecaea monophora]KAH0840734.1 hypothetical protein FOPE_06015 [Fonsecaea pedrosoi]OAG45267.1 hypothetical protein AYO21_00615 [Fonsecaea monophora]